MHLCTLVLFFSCPVGLSFKIINFLKNNQKILIIKTNNTNQLQNDTGRLGRIWLTKEKFGLNICLYFGSVLISVYIFGLILQSEQVSWSSRSWYLPSLKKWVGLNILVESVLIFSILVTGPLFSVLKYDNMRLTQK